MSAPGDVHGAAARPSRRGERSLVRSIVERLADGIVIADGEGIVRFVNPAAERLFGRPAAELVGQDFGHPVVGGETTEIDLVRPGAAPLTVELRSSTIDWEGQAAYVIALRDVTERKAAEAQARALEREQAARAEAEAANRAKSDFLAVMSHELRTPLNAILGYTDLLDLGLGGPPLSEPQRQQLSRIAASGQHLLGLVNEILDLAKVEAGRLSVRHEPFRAAEAAESALVIVQPLAEAAGLTIVRDYEVGSQLHYIGDDHRVRQVLINLLSNAVKFTPAGGRVTLEIHRVDAPEPDARLHGDGEWVRFRVTDTGIGIAPDDADAVFAPFVQVQPGHTRSRDGSGLGLTVSRRLARLMGGDITLRSAPGEGSAFSLWLPRAAQADATGGDVGAALSGSEPSVRGLAEVGETLLREVDPVLECVVSRVRSERLAPHVEQLSFSQVADHLATLIADFAGTLIALEEGAGEPSALLADGGEIQRIIAEKHGAQRARLGWTREAFLREHVILREEIERALRRCFLGEPAERLREPMSVIERLTALASEQGARALQRALAP